MALERAGWLGSGGWITALRGALTVMFLLTASAHWGKRRPDLVRMVPPAFKNPGRWVTVTGVLEIMGAIGLLIARLAAPAALGLSLLLLALLPANIKAARERLTIAGRPVTPLLPRVLLQLVFLAATLMVFFQMLPP
jgi:uncharacterized membrane protein